jgi:hypothetical protein
MPKRLIIAVLLILIVAALAATAYILLSRSTSAVDSSVFNIVLERGPCFGSCPVYTLTIDNNGNVSLKEKDQPEQTYKVDKATAKQIYTEIQSVNFFKLNDKYEDTSVTDLPSTKITVQTPTQTKSVYMYGLAETVPPELTLLATRIDTLARTNLYLKSGVTDASSSSSSSESTSSEESN